MTSSRSLLSWRIVLGIAVAIHVDWHLARPVGERLSAGWSAHWLLAVPVFLAAAWYLARRWPGGVVGPAIRSVGLGVVLGQIVEPLGEALVFGESVRAAFEAARVRAFATFLLVGLATLALALPLFRWRAGRRLTPS